jgi:hypothetical protein
MKLESIVILNKKIKVKFLFSFVHTARHIMRILKVSKNIFLFLGFFF